jgi:hypothetical protein
LFNKQRYKGGTRQHQNRFYPDGPRRDTKRKVEKVMPACRR